MSTHPSVEANLTSDANCVPKTGNTFEVPTAADHTEGQLFRTVSKARDIAPIAYMPSALADKSSARSLRRILTRDQGRALEAIGHAVDYLNDCYLYEGPDDEIINISGFPSDAIQILVSLRSQILLSAQVREPRTLRFWNALFHRNSHRSRGIESHRRGDRTSQSKPAAVLPLSSSR